jgi:hypothetical protein
LPATPSYKLTSSSALSDDYIWTADVLIDMTSPSPVAVFNYQNNPQALVVRSDGVLCHIRPSSGASSAAWAVNPVGSTSGVTQAVAGLQSDGTAHGFYTDAQNTYHVELTGSGWSAPETLPLCNQLSAAVNGTSGELVVYGVDSSGNLQLITGLNAPWASTSLANSPSLTGLRPVLLITDAANDWVMAVPGSTSSGGSLEVYMGSASAVSSGPDAVPAPNPIQAVIYGYWYNNSALFLFTDTQNNLYTSAGSTTVVAQIPNISVAQAAAMVGTSNNLHVYATDPSGTMSVLHQTGWDNASNTPLWAPVIPLDKGRRGLFSDTNPLDTAAFFATDNDGALWRYSQNVDSESQNMVWGAHKAQMPGGLAQSYRVAQYRTEITVTDQNGNPAPNLQISVSASTNSSILVQGLSYPVGPSTTATITTGLTGRAHLSTVAYDLVTPRLTFTAPGLTTTGPVNPAAAVHTYLTGTGTLNSGTSQQLQTFSGTTVQKAKVNNAYLAPKTQTTNPSTGLQLATAACSGIQSIFQIPTVTAASPAPVGFALDLSDREHPVFQSFATEEEYQAYRAKKQTSDLGLLGGWWGDVASYAEDFWHGIRRAAIAVTSFVVHTADAVMDLVVTVGNEIHNVTGAFVSGLESAVSAIQGVFAWIGAEVDALIAWLKMLFDWQDILNTCNALKEGLTGSFPYLQALIADQGEPLVNGFFSKLEGQVTSSFATIMAQFSPEQTLASLVPSSTLSAATATPLSQRQTSAPAAPISPADFLAWSVNVQNNWLLEKIESFAGTGPKWPQIPLLNGILEELGNSFDTVFTDFYTALNDFTKGVVTLFSDPAQFPTYGVVDFLGAVKNVCLAALVFLDGIIEVFMRAVNLTLASASAILTEGLDIPFLSAIWSALGDLFDMPDFTVSGVFCMALAIPVTILYKIANGPDTQPFPSGDLPSAVNSAAAGVPGASESPAQLGMQYTAAGLAAVWALFDAATDAVPQVSLVTFKIIDILAPILIQVFTWPTGIPFEVVPMNTAEEIANFANWVIGWAYPAFEATILLSTVTWDADSNIGKKIDPYGKVIVSALGGINLAAGIIASAFPGNESEIADNIVGPLPFLAQFLTLKSLNDAFEEIPFAIKLVIDFFAGEGEAVAIAVA